jgi:hypothetical protein
MNLRKLSVRYLEPASQWIMVAGVVALVQPWVDILHRYGVTITLIGLVGFIVFSHVRPGSGN